MKLHETYRNCVRLLTKRMRVVPQACRCLRHPREYFARVRIASAARLPADAADTLKQLREVGFAEAGPLVDPALLAELSAACETIQSQSAGLPRALNKPFFSSLTSPEISADDILVRFALQQSILELVAAYFGESPYLFDINLLASYGSDGVKWDASQLWHLDTGDAKVLKLWVYTTDVPGREQGPFTYLPKRLSRQVPNPFFRRVSDEAMAALGFDRRAVSVTGSRSTAFLIDTRNCYHLGSRVLGENVRVAYIATFISFSSLSSDNKLRGATGPLSPIQRLALQRC